MSAQSPKDTKRQQPVPPVAIWQKIQKYLRPYHQATEQLISSAVRLLNTTLNKTAKHIHPLSVTDFFPFYGVRVFFAGANPSCFWARAGTPWTSRQLIAGPPLMAEATVQGANCTSGAIWGSVSCSRTLRHAAQPSPARSWDLNQRPSNHFLCKPIYFWNKLILWLTQRYVLCLLVWDVTCAWPHPRTALALVPVAKLCRGHTQCWEDHLSE